MKSYFAPSWPKMLAVGMALWPNLIVAQGCEEVLKHGLFESNQTVSSSDTGQAFLNWFCSSESRSSQRLQSMEVEAGIPLPSIPARLTVGGKFGKQDGDSYAHEACRFESGKFTHAAHFANFATKVSQPIVDAWSSCEKNRVGLSSKFTISSDPRTFALELKYTPLQLRAGEAKINVRPRATVSQATSTPQVIGQLGNICQGMEQEFVLAGSRTFSCTRPDVDTSLHMTFETTPAMTTSSPIVNLQRRPPAPVCMVEQGRGEFDIILCSGENCKLQHLVEEDQRKGWYLVQWWNTSDITRQRTRVIDWPGSMQDMLRDATKDQLTFDFWIVDNAGWAQFFDLDGSKANYFEFSGPVRDGFKFVNNYEHEADKHIRLRTRIGYPRQVCR